MTDVSQTEKKRVWIQLAEVGTFRGHPAGAFELSPKVFSEIVANFKRDGLPIPIDFEHASEQPATEGSIPEKGAPAMGWIHELDNRGAGGLWGLVEWLEPARSYIKAGNYKFISPAIRFGARDRVSGEPIGARLTSAGITNQPFLRHLQPLAAKDRPGGGPSRAASIDVALKSRGPLAHAPGDYMPQIRAALAMHPAAPASACMDTLDTLRDHLDAVDGDASATHEGVQLSTFLHPLRDLTGAKPGDTWDEILDRIEDLIQGAIARHELEDHLAPDGASMDDEGGGVDEGGGLDGEGEDQEQEGGGGAEMRDAPAAAATTKNTTPASAADKETNMPTADELKTLSDKNHTLEQQVHTLSAEKATLTAQASTLGLELKDAQATVAKLEGELKTLKDAEAARKAADETARVEEAFGTYKDKKNLTDDDKDAMLIVLRNDAAKFERLYPRVPAGERHLLADVSGGQGGGNGNGGRREVHAPNTAGGAAQPKVGLRALSVRIARERGISLGEAQIIAEKAIERQRSAG